MTHITAYPDAQTDVDGLAIGDGRAYLVIDEPGSIYVWDLAGAAFDTPLTNPWATTKVFAGGAWIDVEGVEPEARATFAVDKIFDDGNSAEVEVTISCNTGLFEGIPTLGQYGLAVLALLMLGVGFVAFRRFV